MSKYAYAALLLVLVLFAVFCIPAPLPVNAAPRTIVVPDDYSTISAAIESASDGDTILVKNGTYHENVRVTKAITLVGEDNQETRIDGNAAEGYWVPLALRHDNCVVSNLNLCNSHAGLQLGTVKNCTVVGNRIIANSFGIEIGWSSSGNTIKGNIVASNGEGISIKGGANNLIQGNEILSNNMGIYLDQQTQNNSIIANRIDSNRDEGIRIILSWDNTIKNNTIMNTEENAIAVAFANNNTFRHNNFINNTRQYFDGGEDVPQGMYPYVGYTSKNVFMENFWSDYRGEDYDGDGKGDSPYSVYKQNIDLTPLMVPVAFPKLAVPSTYEPPASPSSGSSSEPSMTEVFLTASIVTTVVAAVAAGAGLLVYSKKHKR